MIASNKLMDFAKLVGGSAHQDLFPKCKIVHQTTLVVNYVVQFTVVSMIKLLITLVMDWLLRFVITTLSVNASLILI